MTQNNQSQMLPAVRPSALSVMAARFDMEPRVLMDTLKNTVFKGATNEQLAALVIVANEHNLNPFTREIYAFPDKAGGIQAVISVDGWIRIITQNKSFDGVTFQYIGDGDEMACEATIHVKGRAHPVVISEYLEECRRNSDAWRSMPRRMLRHRALIQAGRIAFGLGSLKDEEDVVLYPASAAVTANALFQPTAALPQPVSDTPPLGDVVGGAVSLPPAFEKPPKEKPARTRAEKAAPSPTAPVELPRCRHCGKLVPDMATHECAGMKAAATGKPQEQLEALVTEAGYTLAQVVEFSVREGFMEAEVANRVKAFADIPDQRASFLLRNRDGLLIGLKGLAAA